jgi:hypothetical protein
MNKARETKTRYQVAELTSALDKDLAGRLRYAAEWRGIAFEEAAKQAVTEYLTRFAIEKVTKEQERFEKMREQLLPKYRGQYVAIHDGEVVEHAPDLRSLHHKVFVRFGFTPMLHIQVTDEPERVIVVRSPRLVR